MLLKQPTKHKVLIPFSSWRTLRAWSDLAVSFSNQK